MFRLRDLSIKAKLSAGFGLSLALIFAIGMVSLVQLRGINSLATQVTENWLPEMEVLGRAKRAMDEHRLLGMRRINITNFRLIAADVAKMQEVQAEVEENVGHYRRLTNHPLDAVRLARFTTEWAAYRSSLDVVFARLDAGDPNSAKDELDTTTAGAFDQAASTIDDLLGRSRVEGLSAAAGMRSAYTISLLLIVGVLLFAALSVATAVRWITLNVSRPILRISNAMQRVTAGDNSVVVSEGLDRKDEIGVLVNAVSGYRDSLDRVRQLAAEANRERQRFDAALTNMSQGLCMFDADGKLTVSNARFAEIIGITPETNTLGMTTRELMTIAHSVSGFTDVDPEGTLALQQKLLREDNEGPLLSRLTDGRTLSVSHRRMTDGGFVATFEDITERLLAENKIKYLAHYDALTGLLNRSAFYEQMVTILSHLRRSESIAVLSLDLDRFKNINDTLGHPIGDLLLQSAAARMRSCLRGEDILARLGGDEFAIVQIPSEQPSNVTALADRLIEVLAAPYDLDGHQVVVGTSVGVAIAPDDGDKPDVLMKNADLALYRAKADGGEVVRFFEIEMDARMQARRALELDLRKAIVNGEFELHYQPIVDVKTGQITSCEALLRWHHPERGMIAPLDFIPIAEETGLIVPLGEWVLRQACGEAARWPKNITIAVNLSPAQFKSRNLVPTIVSALATSGISASQLELEITEQVLLQDNEGAFVVLHQLRGLGIKIAMDDFGTGYSSLSYLRSFPFDKIKIDQSFIRDLPGKEDSVAIVRAVVGLSSSLGITTIAEGVETKEQLASLTAEGCTEFQGFLYSRPRSAEAVARIIADQVPRNAAVA